jgi:ABC-2 type transport system ATP-binding protein
MYGGLQTTSIEMTPALSISHLRKVYRRGTVGIEDISLEVAPGDFFGFLGPNGAGKSTTIHCITGIAEPTSGTIEVFGVDAVKHYRDARRLIGLSPQEFNVDQFATVRDIVDWMGGYFGMTAQARHARGNMLIERFELGPHAKKPFRELSGGLKRRVMLARAMIHDPSLLILDEPTAGVDVELRRDLWRYLEELNRDGKTIFLTSHYLEEVERLCRTITIVAGGRIVRNGLKDEFVAEEGGIEAAYLRATGGMPAHIAAPAT